MNFFRRNSTKIPTPLELEFDAKDLRKIRLWGSIFFYIPRSLANPRSSNTDGKTIALCYRGTTYKRELPIPVVETEGKTVVLTYRGHTYERKL